MSSGQSNLIEYGASGPQPSREEVADYPDYTPRIGFKSRPSSVSLTDEILSARNVNWVVFTGRYPYVFDAARLGFGIGHREDASYQWVPDEVELPVHFLDNDYQDSDIDRFVDRVFEYEPEIAVLGDIYEPGELPRHIEAAEEIWGSFPDIELMLVPKCEDVLDHIPTNFILGYPNGSSPIQATDIASHRTWRSLPHRLHILGGTPLSTHDEIVELTKQVITGEPPADIAGLDWNGYQRYAENRGDYAAATGGWHRNLRDRYPPKRDLIRYSLLNAKHFWISKGVWPDADVDDLPTREDLLTANRKGPVNLTDQSDQREILISPPPSSTRREHPIYRTDKTQAEIIEPLSPLASLLSELEWEPDGAFSTATAYRTPQAHYTEPTCTGCGAHVFAEPEVCTIRSAGTTSYEFPDSITIQVVSYEHHVRDKSHDYDSVPEDGPDSLECPDMFPSLHVFCSDQCRKRVEGRDPQALLNGDSRDTSGSRSWHLNGELVAKLEVPTRF